MHSTLRYASVYLTGMTSNASVLSWNGIQGKDTLNNTLKTIFRSGTENIGAPVEEFTARSCIISGAQNCHVKKFGNLTERFLIPHGLCKVYIGMPFHNMWFTVADDGAVGEYVLFIADVSASNAFTVSSQPTF